MQLRTVIAILLLTFFATRLSAVSPDIRLPDWQKHEIRITEWQPEQKTLMLSVSIKAINTAIKDISCSMFLPWSQQTTETKKRELLEPQDKAIFIFRLQVPETLSSWLDIDLRAQPDKEGLKNQIAKFTDKPLTVKVLNDELKSLNAPIMLGKSIPVFVANDIALSATSELTFRPEIEINGHKFYIWLPPANFGSGLTKESFKALKNALKSGNFKAAIAASKLLSRRIEKHEKPIAAKKDNGDTFIIPTPVLKQVLEANMALLQSLAANNDSKPLQKHVKNAIPSFSRPFLLFNLGQIYNMHQQDAEAHKYLQMALKDIPAWPLAKKLIKE